MTEHRILRLRQKIQESRCRLMKNAPYYALLLMYFRFVAVRGMQKISTNGRCIYFDPDFLEKLYDKELDYILCHQVLHVVCGHIWKAEKSKDKDFHFACNIIINSKLKEQNILPGNTSRFKHSFNVIPGTNMEAGSYSPEGILCHLLFRPSRFDEKTRSRYLEDSDGWWDKKDDCGRGGILILDMAEGDPIIRTPGPKPNESERKQVPPKKSKDKSTQQEKEEGNPRQGKESKQGTGSEEKDDGQIDGENTAYVWELRSRLVKSFVTAPDKSVGKMDGSINVPSFLRRMYAIRQKARIDWRQLLNSFIQEQVADYSFSPPDRRFQDTGFFLPELNEKEFVAREVLFMVDTSGSINEEVLSQVYAEICGACEQFQGKLLGQLGFFDADVTEPIPFENVEDILSIIPYGGGGTDFSSIFRYLHNVSYEVFPSCVIVFTDGNGRYPDENETMGIPVMWILDNETWTPPFGKVIRYPGGRDAR